MEALSWTQALKWAKPEVNWRIYARLLLPVLLAIELSLRWQMCNLQCIRSKFEEDRAKIAVAIVDDRYFWQRDRQT